MLRRRATLALPALALLPPGSAARAAMRVPPFTDWVGRTARLTGEAGAARLLLARDGTGMIAVRAFFACRPLAVLSWQIAADGQAMQYRRVSAVFAGRVIEGTARIAPGAEALHWIEAQDHVAEFVGFEPPEAARSCA